MKGMEPYAVSIPTREDILEVLSQEGVPVAPERLAAALRISPEQVEGFERRVAAMEREGQIHRNRRGHLLIADKAGLIKGKVIGHPDGFGFLKPEEAKEDLFLGPKEMHKVLHGDVVLARLWTDVDGGAPTYTIIHDNSRSNVHVWRYRDRCAQTQEGLQSGGRPRGRARARQGRTAP